MEQQPDGRYHWEPPCVRPLCYTCEADADLWQYDWGGDWFLFCSRKCAAIFARKNHLHVEHDKRVFFEPYNGAYMGNSPYDMDADECRPWRDYDPCDDEEDDDGDYDCCDDAEDYGEEE